MNRSLRLIFLTVLLAVIAPVTAIRAQTTFFSDDFADGSTIDSATPTAPTINSASYEALSGKPWTLTPFLSSQNLEFGIASTSSGTAEIQALFATNPVVLTATGDYIQMVVVFTNISGPLTAGQSYLGFGLYNTGGATNYPVAGGLNGTATSSYNTNTTGGAQNWQGYVAQVAYTGYSSQIMTRSAQNTGTLANNDQDLVTSGSSSYSYSFPDAVTIGSKPTSSLLLSDGGTYTEVLTITLDSPGNLAITNALYSGADVSGAPLTQFGAVASGSSYLTASFNGLAAGFYEKTSGPTNTMDISSIVISGQSTVVSAPPAITTQPAPVLVTTNGSCAFSIAAQGFNVSYQWFRNGTNLTDGGNISGAASDMLVISPASVTDELSQADGYYCIVTGAGDYSTNSITNSLTLIASTNLIWTDNNGISWDVDNSVNWEDTNGNASVFNFGDPVTFNDVGAGGYVDLTNSYLSAASVTVNGATYPYTFEGSGSFAGPGALYYTGSAELIVSNVNTYTGGTLISNPGAYLLLENLGGLGSGTVTLGGGEMEITPAGSGSSGIEGNVDVTGNFTILVDATNNSYSGVFLGDLAGTAGQTLTITNGTTYTSGLYRVRAYGNDTVYDANLNLANSAILFASYSSANSQTYNGVISGPGAFMEKGTITYLNGANTYSGGTTPAQGAIGLGISSVGSPVTSGPIGVGPLLVAPDSTTTVTGNGEIFASGSAITIGNPIQFPSGTNNLTLVIGGSTNLTLTGPFTLNGNDGVQTNTITARNVEVTNTSLTTFSGVISDGSLGYGLNITGSGVLALDNIETYTGPTIISNATVLVNGQIGSGSVTVATNGTLGGAGVITGPVTIQEYGTLAAGNEGIGTLTIDSSLTFASGSTNSVAVNASAHDLVTGLTSVTYNGTLFATNLGGTLSAGDTFTIFSAENESGNFTAVTGSPGPGLGWSFDPTNGVLSVVASVATNPTNITFSVSSGNLNLSWPADHLGWYLQVQTNSLARGLSTNWVTVPNSSAVDSTNVPISATNGAVFYRLMYP